MQEKSLVQEYEKYKAQGGVQSTKSYQKNFLFFMHNLGIIIKKEGSKNYVIRKSKKISGRKRLCRSCH